MDLGSFSEDQLDQLIVRGEAEIAAWRAVEMAVVAEKKRRCSHRLDGYRSIVDWFAARADVSHETARRVCWTTSRLADAPEVAELLASGEVGFERAEQMARLPESVRSEHEGYDISGLRRLVAHHKRLTRKREGKVGNGHFHFGSEELVRTFWGELPGIDSRIVEKAVDQRADEIIGSEAKLAVSERRALALVAICQNALYDTTPDPEATPTEVAVTVDARVAAPVNGESGVSVLTGPRVGPRTLEEILCDGIVEVVGIDHAGKPLDLGRRSRTVNRKLRRHVLTRDGGCTVDGCPSKYRLEVHHVLPWAHGGRTDAADLITLCWYHHHIAVHREGLEVVRLGPSRVRLKRPR